MPGIEAPQVAKIYPSLVSADVKPEPTVGATTQVPRAVVTQTQAVMRGTATGLKMLLTPWLVSTLSGAVRAWASTPDRTGFNYLMGAMIFTAGPLLVQGFNHAIDSIEATIERPELAKEAMTSALATIKDPVGSLDGAFRALMKNVSPHLIAKQSREMLAKIVTVGTIGWLQSFAGGIRWAPLAASVRTIAPAIGATVGTAVDYSLHRLAPLFEVDPDTVPGVGKPYLLLRSIPTTVTARTEAINGTYHVTLATTGQSVAQLSARGSVVIAFADEGRIQSFVDLSKLVLLIGDLELENLTGTWSPAGLVITHADATKKSGEKVELGKLEISPFGWLSGELTIGGEPKRFGSEFVHGFGGGDPTAKPKPDDATPSAKPASGGGGLVGHIKTAMSGKLGTVASEALHVVHYMTGGKNGASKDSQAPAEPTNGAHSLAMKLFGAEPAALLEKLSDIQLIPSSMKNRVGMDVTELRVGEEPSVTLGLDAWIRPFPKQAQPSGVEGLKLIWLVNKEPFVLLQASELVVDPKHGVFCGIEADPAGGLRIAAARIVLPGPDLPGLFSKELVAIAEGVRIGETFDARTATAMINDLRIANALTVGQFSVTMKNLGEAHQFAAAIRDAKLDLPQVKASVPLAILEWVGEGKELAAFGTANLDAPVVVNDMLTIDTARLKFAIAPSTKYGSGSAGITFHLDRYTGHLDASVELDGEGVRSVKLDAATLHDGDAQAVDIKGLCYERGKTLKVEHAKIAVPEKGLVRGEPTDKAKPSAIVLENLDFSALVRKPATEGEKPATEGEKPATEGEKPAAPVEDRKAWSIKGENLSKLIIGPAGHDILTVDFTKAEKPEASAGGMHAAVTLNLGGHAATSNVDVYPAKEGLDRVTAMLGELKLGTALKIQSASFDGARLVVKHAELDIKALLGEAWPSALDKVAAAIALDLDIDTKTGKLELLQLTGTAHGELFGKHLTLGGATVSLRVEGAQLAKGPAIVTGGTLGGSLGITDLVLELFGAEVRVTEGKLAVGQTVTGTFSGSGKVGNATVAVTGLQLLPGNKVMLGSVKTTFSKPEPADGIVKFLPPKSTCETPEDKPVTISLAGVGFDATTGQVLFASDEEVTAEGAAKQAGPGPKLELENLGGLDVAGGAVRIELADKITAEKVRGKNEAKISAAADFKLGPLAGKLDGTAYLALGEGEPAATDKAADHGVKVDRSRVRIEGSGKLGALTVTNAKVQRGQLSAESASIDAGELFANIPGAIEAGFANTKVAVKDLNIDLATRSFSGGGEITRDKLALFDGKLVITQPSVGVTLASKRLADSGPLVGIDWKATLEAGSIAAHPLGELEITAGKTRFELGPDKLSARIANPSIGWKLAATAKQIEVDNTGFLVNGAAIHVDSSVLSSLGVADLFKQMPGWLSDGGSTPLVVRLGALDFGYRDHAVVWPSLDKLRFGVRKAGLKIGPALGAFDLDEGTVTLGVQDKGSLKLTYPMPVAYGVGFEIGGGLDYDFGFETKAKAAKEEDLVRVIADLEARAKLAGVLYVGLFGGVPSVFSAAAGLYAGITLDAGLQARAVGAMQLPTSATKKGGGQLDLTFTFKDKQGQYPTLAGVAGAYASLHFMGTSRTLKKQLAKVNFAQLHAHGAVSVAPGQPLKLLPSRDQFPAYKFHLHEDIRTALFDADFTEEYDRSQQRLDKSFAKVWAAEEMLADKRVDPSAKQPWKDQKPELEKQATATHDEVTSAKRELASVSKSETASADILVRLRDKLDKYRWHHAQLVKAEEQAKTPSTMRMIADAVRHPRWGIRPIKLVKGKPCIEGQPALEKDAVGRVDDPTFPELLGLRDEQQWLDAEAYARKIELKEQEIAIVEDRRLNPALKRAEDRVAKAEAADTKAQTKVDLSTESKKTVEERLGKERDGLLESLYVASKVQTANDDKLLKSAATIEQLQADVEHANKQVAALEKKPDAPSRAALLAFWHEHQKFLADEIKFVTDQREAQHHLTQHYTASIDPTKAKSLATAAETRGGKVKKLEKRIKDKIEARRGEIEDSLRELQARYDAIAKKPGEDQGESVQRIERALELQKKQLATYIDNIARLSALIGT